ncbi:MAG TPA: tyrosine-type recombinase/integrase [Urbifossiella sp.]|nr:tyrosine-type recombinase/integrase [Urbifossiella sp.]
MFAFREWAKQHYRMPDGRETSEVREYELVIRHTRELYGETLAAEFGPLNFKAVRQKMILAGWSRGVINQRMGRLERIFKWAVAEQMIPAEVHYALAAVPGLKKGRTEARETDPVKPVDPSTVDSTIPSLNRHVRAMVELQRVTGMRPGEVCRLRLADVDRSAEPWVYRLVQHKTLHHGKDRAVMIGPKGRKVIEQFIADCSRRARLRLAANLSHSHSRM